MPFGDVHGNNNSEEVLDRAGGVWIVVEVELIDRDSSLGQGSTSGNRCANLDRDFKYNLSDGNPGQFSIALRWKIEEEYAEEYFVWKSVDSLGCLHFL